MYSDTPNRRIVALDHFMPTNGQEGWTATLTGASTAISTTAVVGTQQNPGWNTLQSGTTTTGRSKLNFASSGFLLGASTVFMQGIVQIPTLSIVADEFRSYFGLYDGSTGDGTDVVQFMYDRSTNGDFWCCVTGNNTVYTTTVTSQAIVAGTNYRLGIEINVDASRAKFFINGALVATHTANIPKTTGRETQFSVAGRKTAGTTNTNMIAIDHFLAYIELLNPTWTA